MSESSEKRLAETATVIGLIVHAFPTPAWSDETIAVYVEFLSHVPRKILVKAVRRWIETEHQRPSIAALREMVDACTPVPPTYVHCGRCGKVHRFWPRAQRETCQSLEAVAPRLNGSGE